MTSFMPEKTGRHAAAPCASAMLLVLALSACGGGGGGGGGGSNPNALIFPQVPPPEEVKGLACQDLNGNPTIVKPKTVAIHNNSDSPIYPVLTIGPKPVDEWLQGCFRTTAKAYPSTDVYKLYVNEGKGIPKNASVEITLPLYSELAADRYITWWNGGRVVLADRSERLRDPDDKPLPAPVGVGCSSEGTGCDLSIYAGERQFPDNVYAQLSEYTFGAFITPAGQTKPYLNTDNVGYNISYVDHVYMPVAIGPKHNPYIGYSGSSQPLAEFRSALRSFLGQAPGLGWPVYNLEALKLPGGYNVFAQRSGTFPKTDNVPVKPATDDPPVLTVLACIEGNCTDDKKRNLHFGESVQHMQNLWGSCVAWGAEDISAYVTASVQCPADLKGKLDVVKQFFEKNHADYLKLYTDKKCTGTTALIPKFDYWQALTHIYGWVPFNEGCGAGVNPLGETTIPGWDHAKIQPMYIHELQYNHLQPSVMARPELTFNPYVKLIHDSLKMNAYAFSVDDAVGFMSELGDGLIFAVGGPKGLENGKQFSYAGGFFLNIGIPQSLVGSHDPLLKKYGVCALGQDPGDPNCVKDKQDVSMPVSGQISGFRVGTVPSYPIRIRFTDAKDNVYSLVVSKQYPVCADPTQCLKDEAVRKSVYDPALCSVVDKQGQAHPESSTWCASGDPNQDKQLTKNFLNFLNFQVPVD
jgi:hypothetical protein